MKGTGRTLAASPDLCYSQGREWAQARLADVLASRDGEWASAYARVSASVMEDFAESIMAYVIEPAEFVLGFPNRDRVLRKLLRR